MLRNLRLSPSILGMFIASAILSCAAVASAQSTPGAPPPLPPPPPAEPPPPPGATQPQVVIAQPTSTTVQWSTYGARPASAYDGSPRIITDWNEGEPIPPGYRRVERVRTGPLIAGSILFGSLYFLTVLTAATVQDSTSDSNVSSMYIPAIGPFAQMTQTHSSSGNLLLAVDGVGQCAGLALFIYGLASPRTLLMREVAGVPVNMHIAPLAARNAQGLSVLGTF